MRKATGSIGCPVLPVGDWALPHGGEGNKQDLAAALCPDGGDSSAGAGVVLGFFPHCFLYMRRDATWQNKMPFPPSPCLC